MLRTRSTLTTKAPNSNTTSNTNEPKSKYTKKQNSHRTPNSTTNSSSSRNASSRRSILYVGHWMILLLLGFVGLIYMASSWHHRPHELVRSSNNNIDNHISNNNDNRNRNRSSNNINKLRKKSNPKTKLTSEKLAGDIVYDYTTNANANANQGRISRGEIGLPISRTPALIGAQRGTIQCPSRSSHNNGDTYYTKVLQSLAYWNDPRGTRDLAMIHAPFAYHRGTTNTTTNINDNNNNQGSSHEDEIIKKEQYLVFEPDSGGWNNIRMSMESVFVYAAATGTYLLSTYFTWFLSSIIECVLHSIVYI